MRFWLSGPRLFGGLIRPGVSFSDRELRNAFWPHPRKVGQPIKVEPGGLGGWIIGLIFWALAAGALFAIFHGGW